ncbi:SRPBCC family protein [Xylanimonas protaetiae]|uniref:Polyketide cyclase n=1 Tax=Xylanimonas protaetiae TaxID=2509457 RepID=A0A4P6F0Y2_9MICO|nr:SRPBCC family protein [Xylanimonas protaetiae]QAY69410.1 polyketide cyclase [Xylanimonas protaetiae]
MRYDTTVDIAASPDAVWGVLEDVEAWPRWTRSMTSVRRTAAGHLLPGEHVKVRQPGLPAADWTVTAVDPGASFTWVSKSPGVTTSGTHVVAPTASGSRVTLTIEQHGPLAPLVGVMLGGKTRRFVEIEAAGLRDRLEHETA